MLIASAGKSRSDWSAAAASLIVPFRASAACRATSAARPASPGGPTARGRGRAGPRRARHFSPTARPIDARRRRGRRASGRPAPSRAGARCTRAACAVEGTSTVCTTGTSIVSGCRSATAARSAAAQPVATRPQLRQNARLSQKPGFAAAPPPPSRDWIAVHTRRGGWTSAMPAAIGASRLSHSATVRRRAASSRSQAWKRRRARPRSVPSTYSAASLSCSAGFPLYFIVLVNRTQAAFQPLQSPPHPGLHRPERLVHVARKLRVREALVEREHDRLALFPLEPAKALAERLRIGRPGERLERTRILARHVLERIVAVVVGPGEHHLEVGPPQPVQAPVAHDAGHPGHRCRPPRLVRPGVVPDADVAVLQHLLRPVLPPQYTHGDAEQFRGSALIKAGKCRPVLPCAGGQQAGEDLVLGGVHVARPPPGTASFTVSWCAATARPRRRRRGSALAPG